MREQLEHAGFTLKKITNHFGSGRVYQGLHNVFSKDGLSFELQFHTPESYEIMKDNHYDYEVNRSRFASNDIKKIQKIG